MNEELIAKARSAKSAEELLALAKENGTELDAEQAAAYFEQINKSGELSDDELDNVSGGGCQTKVGGEKHTVVTSGCRCFTGQYESIYTESNKIKPNACPRVDGWLLYSSEGTCGRCMKLGLKNGLGYCMVG